MINIQDEILTAVKNAINIDMSTDITITPSIFPHITVAEQDNVNYTKTIDTGSNENYVEVMYQVDIFSKNPQDRVAESYQIAGEVDDVMLKLGFNRVSLTPIPELEYYRLSVRYNGVVSKELDGTNYIYRS